VDLLRSWPYPATVAALFVIVLLRANATYWLGRAAWAGADRTRLHRLLSSAAFCRAQRLVRRWGAPVVTASFLTVGIQTAVNLAAGVTRMPQRRYLPAVIVGGVIWAFLYATAGFVTFGAWRRLYEVSAPGAVALVVVLVLALGLFLWRQLGDREGRDPRRDPVAARPPGAGN
jgi:membrane protein DedA with SNARE-associated domain